MIQFKLEICKNFTEDSYLNGEIGKFTNCGMLYDKTFNTLDNVLDYITANYGKPYIFDDRLIVQVLENENSFKIDKNSMEFEQWVKGEIKGYAVTYDFYIEEQITREFKNRDLKQAFNNLQEH